MLHNKMSLLRLDSQTKNLVILHTFSFPVNLETVWNVRKNPLFMAFSRLSDVTVGRFAEIQVSKEVYLLHR